MFLTCWGRRLHWGENVLGMWKSIKFKVWLVFCELESASFTNRLRFGNIIFWCKLHVLTRKPVPKRSKLWFSGPKLIFLGCWERDLYWRGNAAGCVKIREISYLVREVAWFTNRWECSYLCFDTNCWLESYYENLKIALRPNGVLLVAIFRLPVILYTVSDRP